MNPELTSFLSSVGAGVLIGGSIAIPILVMRWRRGEKLFTQSKPTPRWVWPFGILVFGSLATMSFLTGRPIFGSAFSLATIPYAVGQTRALTKNKANKPQHPTA
ncbi:hypothetical protein HNR46_004248 [Haloferula luteola]|uniref:Uncharacterized protein n=1 Tax=Haloferula luteola TaxID=595692 RepID=A0A840V6U0_9BACT|nr:hypothetical protein [Haloferula luteola]MBB5353977.1 hypothetical protein [Haloferula luteola]